MYFKHSTKRLSKTGQNSKAHSVRDFPERINVAIEQAGGAQELAQKLGVSILILQGWQSGKTEPSRSALIKIAKATNLSLHWLASGENAHDKCDTSPRKHKAADLDSLEHAILKTRKRFVQQRLDLRSRAEAQVVRLLYEFYLHKGHHMDDESLDNLIERLAPR